MNKRVKAVSFGMVVSIYLIVAAFAVGLTAAFSVAAECDRVEVCHLEGGQTTIIVIDGMEIVVDGVTLCVDEGQPVQDHLSHGDYLGPCTTSPSN